MLNTVASQSYNGRQTSDSSAVIHSTRNYAMFRFSNANRAIDQNHLETLYDSVAAKNMLAKYPIVVTPELLVIDGQHRLKVAEALGVPIYYIIANDASIDDIRLINAANKRWSSEDYLHYWCEQGIAEYLEVREFLRRYPWLSVSSTLRLLNTTGANKEAHKAFRNGRLSVRNLPRVEQLANMALDFKPYLRTYYTYIFLSALSACLDIPDYNHTTMLKRLEYQSTRLVPCVKTEDYVTLLGTIYNYRTRPENVIDFSVYMRERAKRGYRTKQQVSNVTELSD